jgi:hypothetical protein
LQLTPADALGSTWIGVPTGPLLDRTYRHVDVEGALRQQAVALLRQDVVQKPGNRPAREGRLKARICRCGRNPVGDRIEAATVILAVCNLPAP